MNTENNKMKFEDFNFSPQLMRAINKLGYSEPTEIQAKTIPAVLEGSDVLGESATGSGKTLAFGVGAIETSKPKQGLQTLILVPTRELAEQVMTSIKDLNSGKSLKLVSIYGGVSINPQMDALRYSEIAIATPGRLKDHIQRGTINLSNIKLLILDEADRMLDMGFADDIEDIVKQCPKQRQTLFFSATFPPQVKTLTKKYLKVPVQVKVQNQVDPKLLKQIYYDVRRGDKLSLLIHLIRKESADKIMIFCNTRINSDLVQQNLKFNKISAEALHGGFTQASRTKVIDKFKEGKSKVLVCTDVAARGIHVDDVTHIYNYDIPKDHNDYVHRIGRTARAGSEGLVINLLCDFDHQNFSRVMSNFDFNIPKVEMPKDMEKIKFNAQKISGGEDRVQSGGRGGPRREGGRGPSRGRSDNRSRGRSQGGRYNRDSRSDSSNEGRSEPRREGSRSPNRSSSRGPSRGSSRSPNRRSDNRPRN
ncbi:MAG: DEAD/DEAH box helicase [Candidatus Woesearchaeota archaeon]